MCDTNAVSNPNHECLNIKDPVIMDSSDERTGVIDSDNEDSNPISTCNNTSFRKFSNNIKY